MQRTWLGVGFALVLSTGALIGACGTSGDGTTFFDNNGGLDGSSADSDRPPSFNDDGGDGGTGGGPCVPKTCTQLAANCGPQGDGCGGVVQCGSCNAPETCGGGGVPSQCGGNSGCSPKNCTQLNANCGPQGDGCGGLIQSCGTCTSPEICGGAGVPNKCGAGIGNVDAGTCTPTKAACAAGDCGPIADGCGGLLQCPGCSAPAICGGGGTPSKCGGGTLPDGGPICSPKTCQQQNANCGPMGDGCGGLIQSCGTCNAPAICGGGGVSSQCGGGGSGDAGACTNLCLQQVNCDSGATTTLTGRVVAPRATNADPIFGATVYVPNGTVAAFPTGASCDQCGGAGQASGNPLVVSNPTGPDGVFTITNMPVGNNIPVVIQLGRWRRQFTINVNNACGVNNAGDLHLPRSQKGGVLGNAGEGDIPLMAMATGNVDTLECLLRKIGIVDNEFTNPNGNGRVRLYVANGAQINNQTPGESTLWGTAAELAKYDLVLFPCEGGEDRETATDKQRIIDYTHAGGRVFATHYSYVWLFGGIRGNTTLANEFSPTGNWSNAGLADPNLTSAPPNPLRSFIDTSFPKGGAFAQWLANVGALSVVPPPMIDINVPRHDLDSVAAAPTSQRWVYSAPNAPTNVHCANNNQPPCPSTVQHYTFNSPVGAAAQSQCGRVLFSDFHVTGGTGAGNFPSECGAATDLLTPQEKVLEFMLFDLASCIQPDVPPPPTCTTKTCQQQGITCGPAGDGCGGLIPSCGNCTGNQTCGGGGVPGQCGGPTCTPKTCQQLGYNCGMAGDGCGGLLNCGTCQTSQNCGGGGQQNVCGIPTCPPTTCVAQNIQCGPAGDGCGNVLQCGPCVPPDTCGGGGTPGQCGHPNCSPQTCQQANANCGPVSDGCGGILQCGDCSPPQTCGGGGVASQCGGGIR